MALKYKTCYSCMLWYAKLIKFIYNINFIIIINYDFPVFDFTIPYLFVLYNIIIYTG